MIKRADKIPVFAEKIIFYIKFIKKREAEIHGLTLRWGWSSHLVSHSQKPLIGTRSKLKVSANFHSGSLS